VLTVLWQGGKLERFWSAHHFVGVLIMLGIFAAWAIPCLEMARASHVANVWSQQFTGRVAGDQFKLGDWLLNIPRGIAYLLPWVVLLPFARFALIEND